MYWGQRMIQELYNYLNENASYLLMKYHHITFSFSDAECMEIYKEFISKYPRTMSNEEFHILIKMLKVFLNSHVDITLQSGIYKDYRAIEEEGKIFYDV